MKVRAKKAYYQVVEAASSLTGKRFNLLVASSLVATAAIIASAATNPVGASPLAALLSHGLAAEETPTETATPSEGAGPGASSQSSSAGGSLPSSGGGLVSEPLPSPAPEPALKKPAGGPEETSAPTTEALPEAGPIKHVTVISLVSPGYDAAFGETTSQMPYLSTELRPQGELLSGYSLLDESSVPNDIAAVSGQKPDAKTKAGCPTFGDCVLPFETSTIADQLTIGHFTWRAYLEGMTDPTTGKPDNCVYPAADEPYPPAEGGYTATRNPFVFFHSLLDLGDCAINDLPLTEIDADLGKAEETPNVTFLTPTLCSAGSTTECPEGVLGGPAAADAFLAEWAPKILKSPAQKKDGLLIVTFNQLDPVPTATPAPAAKARTVGTLMVSRFLSPGATDAKPYDPYSLLRSLEDLFGLTHLGQADGAKIKPFASTALLKEGTGD